MFTVEDANDPQAAPAQPAPASDQFTPTFEGSLETAAVKTTFAPPWVAAPGFGVIATEIGAAVTTMVVLPDFVVSALEVAVIVTVLLGAGIACGATYVAVVDVKSGRVPQAVPEQLGPERLHVTPAPFWSFATVAVNVCLVPIVTCGTAGLITTPTAEPVAPLF